MNLNAIYDILELWAAYDTADVWARDFDEPWLLYIFICIEYICCVLKRPVSAEPISICMNLDSWTWKMSYDYCVLLVHFVVYLRALDCYLILCGRYMLLLVYIVYWRPHWMIHVVGVLSCNLEMCKPRLLQTSTWRLKLWPYSTWKENVETAHHVDCIKFWILKSAKSWDDCWLLVVIIAEQFF